MIKKSYINFHSKKFLLIATCIFIFFLVFFRIYNIDSTARYTRDESSDLVKMYEYYQTRKITLVGPISSANNKVFGSLTYYMLMPFAATGNFTPVSPAYGAAFWGIITALLLLYITFKVNKRLLILIGFLLLIWYPLLQTSRWAWNPHLVLFWITLGIILYLRQTSLGYALAGLSLGLAFHHHYIAVIATSAFIITVCVSLLMKKKLKRTFYFISGYILAFIPFAIFDLRHPPGLFFSHFLTRGQITNTKTNTFLGSITDIGNNIQLFLQYCTQNQILGVILGIICIIILIWDIKNNKKNLLFFIPVIFQLIVGAFLDTLQTRYLLPCIPFFFVWLIIPRKKIGTTMSYSAIGVLIIGALLSIYPQLHYTEVQPDVRTVEKASIIIQDTIKKNNVKDANIAQLASPALDTLAETLRHTLLIRNIHFLAASQYDVSSNLFVLSTADEKTLRHDKSIQMQHFKDAKLERVESLDNSPWKVYWFKK